MNTLSPRAKEQLLTLQNDLTVELQIRTEEWRALDEELAALRERLEAIDLLLGPGTGQAEANESAAVHQETEALSGRALVDQAYRIAVERGEKGVHYRSVYYELVKRGFKVSGTNPAANLLTHIVNSHRFERVGRGRDRAKSTRPRLSRQISDVVGPLAAPQAPAG